jgi:mono/diheme cytochrome c family protein
MARVAQEQRAEAIEVGASLFEINCSGCHGLKAEGIPGLAPSLNDRHFFTERLKEVGWSGGLEDYVISTVSSGRAVSTRPDQYVGGGRPAMPAWSEHYGGPLRDDQIRDIAAFLLNFEPIALGQVTLAEVSAPPIEEQGDPVARGRQVFISSGCGGCHTVEGISTGTAGPNLTKIGEVAATRQPGSSAEQYLRESIVNPAAVVVEGYQPIMPGTFGQTLNQQQMEDVIAFLLAQK